MDSKGARKNVYIVAGITEVDGEQLFNTAVLIGPKGFVGKYRKTHLWNTEKLFFLLAILVILFLKQKSEELEC